MLSGREQRHPWGRAAEHHSSQVCRVLLTQECWCNTPHCTGTKCFESGLKTGAQARRHLFYISWAYECKHSSLKIIFTNVLPIGEFAGLMYREGDASDASSTPCFKANCNMSLVWSLRCALLKASFYLREKVFSLSSETIYTAEK